MRLIIQRDAYPGDQYIARLRQGDQNLLGIDLGTAIKQIIIVRDLFFRDWLLLFVIIMINAAAADMDQAILGT